GIVFSPRDEMVPAKILSNFAKEHERPRIKAAVLDGRLFDDKAIAKLATLPSREVLLAQLIATFIAPMTQFLAALDSTLRLPATWLAPAARRLAARESARRLPATMTDVLEREKQKASCHPKTTPRRPAADDVQPRHRSTEGEQVSWPPPPTRFST